MWSHNLKIFTILFLIQAALAQQFIVPPISGEKQSFDRAIRLERARRFDEAAKIYQDLLKANPKNTRAYLQLKSIYQRQGDLQALEELILTRLSLFPSDLQSHIELGEIYLLQGDKSKALKYWSNMLNQYRRSKMVYRLLIQMYIKHNLQNYLDELISKGREQFNDPALFALELGNIYHRLQDYNRATDEFITYAIYQPNRIRSASSSLMRIAEKSENQPLIEEHLMARLEENEEVIRTLLSDFYFTTGQYNKAFKEHKVLGMEKSQDFDRWLRFGNSLRKENQFSLALETFAMILDSITTRQNIVWAERYRKLTGEALYGLALTYEKQIIPLQNPPSLAELFPNNIFFEDHFYGVPIVETQPLVEAFALYDSILVNMAASTFSAQAHFRLGEIKYRITRDFDGALESFQSARSLTSDNNLIRKSTVRIGDVLVAKGDLKGALDFFNHQIESAQTDKDEKIYLLKKCQVSFFTGEMDTTLYLLRNLIGLLDITDEYLNDVLELKGFVEENYVRASEEGKNAFKTYLQGEYLLRQHKLSEAQLFFDKVTRDYPESFIADDAAFRRAKIHVLLGDFDSAVSGILGLLESPIGDRAATLLGEIYDYHLNDSHEAMQWYLTVLEQHQESMLAEPVRHRIRELSNEMEMN